MKLMLPEIFEQVEKAQTNPEKIAILRKWQSDVMLNVFKINYHPEIKMLLPEGDPPFKKDTGIPVGYGDTNLYKEFRKFYIWIDPNANVNKIKKETLFIQLLESLQWQEAELVCAIKDRKLQLKYKSLTPDLINEAFPGVLPLVVADPVIVEEKKVAKKVEETSSPAKRGRGRPKKTA